MSSRNLTPILSLFLSAAFLTLPQLSSAVDTQKKMEEKLDKPIERYEKNIQKLQSGIEIHLGKLQISSEKEFSLLGDLESIDKKLALQKIRVNVMEERLKSQRDLLIMKIRELNEAQQNKVTVTAHLQERLHAYYLMGKTGILNVTFSTRTLPELMLFNDSFQRLLAYDKDLLNRYRESIEQLTLARESHEKESELLTKYISDAKEEKITLTALKDEKTELLKKVKSEKALYEKALNEMKAAELDLQQSLAKLRKKKKYILQGFVMKKGKLSPPVTGKVLSLFGSPKGDKDNPSDKAQGISIDAQNGAPLKAIFAGRVIFAGYKRGYGNMIIIDHGMDYYSITSRIEKISVNEGDIIEEGDVIGKAGDIATLFEKGVYFEIRHGTEPVDPFEWISREGLEGV